MKLIWMFCSGFVFVVTSLYARVIFIVIMSCVCVGVRAQRADPSSGASFVVMAATATLAGGDHRKYACHMTRAHLS